MKLLEESIQQTPPFICTVSAEYLNYMHDVDWRVSLKYKKNILVLPFASMQDYMSCH